MSLIEEHHNKNEIFKKLSSIIGNNINKDINKDELLGIQDYIGKLIESTSDKSNFNTNNFDTNNKIENVLPVEFADNNFLIDRDVNWADIPVRIVDSKNNIIKNIIAKANRYFDVIETFDDNGNRRQYFTAKAALREVELKAKKGWRLPTLNEWKYNNDKINKISYNGFIGQNNKLFDSDIAEGVRCVAHFWVSDMSHRPNEYLSVKITNDGHTIYDKYGRMDGLFLSVRLVKDTNTRKKIK